jgi:hypothetical protein
MGLGNGEWLSYVDFGDIFLGLLSDSFFRTSGPDLAETFPMDVDYADQTAELMRKKTLVLGEVDSDSQPGTPPEHVQPGKLLQPPASAEPSSGTPHQVEGSKREPGAALEQVALDDQDGSKPMGPKENETSKASVSMVNKLPSSASSSTEAPAAPQESEHTSPGEEADIDTVPRVTRADQHAYKNAKQPRKPRGRKPADDEKKPKRSKGLKKPAACRKRRASKPPAQETNKDEVSDENDDDMPEAKRDLENSFAGAASDAADDDAEIEEPEKPIRKARAKKSKTDESGEGEKGEKNANKDSEKPVINGKNGRPSDVTDKGCQALPLCLKTKSGEKVRVTFAGRTAPKSVEANNRFTVILKAYTDKIAPFLKSSSQVEVGVTKN